MMAGMGDDVAPEAGLFDAAMRWNPETGNGKKGLIDAACQALVDGLDSPSLRELAGASPKDLTDEVRAMLEATFEELGIPAPGTLPLGHTVALGGGSRLRSATDRVRFEVQPCEPDAGGGFEVLVFVNNEEVTHLGAGLGMDPYEVFVPENCLIATAEGRRVPIARCKCGVYGCGMTDVTITRVGSRVHWEWHAEVPMEYPVLFDAEQYDAEVSRLVLDTSWETPERRAGRLVLAGVDRAELAKYEMVPSWVSNDYRTSEIFRVCLQLADQYQVFMDFLWGTHTPESLAQEVCATLGEPPKRWYAQWHGITADVSNRAPKVASRRWSHYHL